jgi:RecB family exonuclease
MRAKPYYSFGSTLHHVLQEFHEQGATHTAEEIVEEMEQTWIGAGYKSQEQEQAHREAGQQMVQAYHAAFQERAAAQVETIATEKTLSYDMGLFRLSGRIDRIDRHADGSLEIIDYKSGRWETTPEQVANDLAMSCYQLIVKRLHPESPVFATISCLRSGITASAAWSDEDLATFEQDLRALGEEILGRNYNEAAPVRMELCEECDFLRVCERYWHDKARHERLDGPHSEDGI